jgi:hypothetical protein
MPAVGSRAQVWHGTADHTSGGLRREDLVQNKYGRIVSRRASASARHSNNLGEFKLPKGSHEFVLGGRR